MEGYVVANWLRRFFETSFGDSQFAPMASPYILIDILFS